MLRFVFVVLLCLLCQVEARKRRRRAGWGRRRRRWIDWGAIDRAARAVARALDRAKRAAIRRAQDIARRAALAADRVRRAAIAAARAAAELARRAADKIKRAAIAAALAVKRAALAAAKFLKDAFHGLVECVKDVGKCIVALLNRIFSGLGLPSPVSKSGNKYCLRPNGMCVTMPSISLKTPPWKWIPRLHCVDIVMMINYWMAYAKAIFNAVMGAISWFLDKLCKVANAVFDFLTKALGMIAKVFQPLMSPVFKLFKPMVDGFKSVVSQVGDFFGKLFNFLKIGNFLRFPMINLPRWSFFKNSQICFTHFGFGLDGCGIKAIYDSIRAALCALRSLNFDKFIKAVKSGIKAVVNFGKNIGKCFKVTTIGLEAVVDAFPFVKTWPAQECLGQIVTMIISSIAIIVQGSYTAMGKAFNWVLAAVKKLAGAASFTRRSNASKKDIGDTHVVGFKSAVDVMSKKDIDKCDKQCFKVYGKKEKGKRLTDFLKENGSGASWGKPKIGLKKFHTGVIAFLHGFLWIDLPFVDNVVAFLVIKLVMVISIETHVGTWKDLQFAIFYGAVFTVPMFSAAMAALKKASPYEGQFPKLGISWTGDWNGASYNSGKRKRANAFLLQAFSLNPKLELGYPAYPGKKWGLTVPIEFKPIWVIWFWSMDDMKISWVPFKDGPAVYMSSFQIEYDLEVFLPSSSRKYANNEVAGKKADDAWSKAVKEGKSLADADKAMQVALGEYQAELVAKGMPEDAALTSATNDPANLSKAPEGDVESKEFSGRLKDYVKVWAVGSIELFKSLKHFLGWPNIIVQLGMRMSLAVMLMGWVFGICLLTCINTKP